MFHLLYRFPATNNIFLADAQNIYIVDSSTGTIIASSVEKSGGQLMDRDSLPKGHVRAVAYHLASKKIAIVSNDKDLQIWCASSFTRLSAGKVFKRAMCMQFSKDGNSLFIGDRTGDLYRFDACDVTQEPALLVGHVSILTSFFFSTDELMLVTADRDEKIKIHHYPQTYDIEHFCMQHKEYISKLWLIPGTNSFVSAGGDEFLVIWNLKTGTAEKTLEFPPKSVVLGDLKPDVACFEYCPVTKTVAIILQKFMGVLLYSVSAKQSSLEFSKLIPLSIEPISLCFDKTGGIWISTTDKQQPLIYRSLKSDAANTSFSTSQKLVIDLANANEADPKAQESVDIYEVSKMRKWSLWKPKEKEEDNKKRSGGNKKENGDDDAVEQKKIKIQA